MAICKYCNEEYEKQHNRQEYCSDHCRIEGYREKAKLRKREERKRYRWMKKSDKYWGLGSGYLSGTMKETFAQEQAVITREMKRLRLKA